MRFYRIDWSETDPTAQQVDWATNAQDAARIGNESADFSISIIDVPTDKAGLLAFLKANVWRR